MGAPFRFDSTFNDFVSSNPTSQVAFGTFLRHLRSLAFDGTHRREASATVVECGCSDPRQRFK